MAAHPGYALAQVEKRDHGVCCSCGLDCARLERLIDRLARVAYLTIYRMPDGTLERGWYGRGERVDHPAALRRREQLGIALAILGMWAGHHLIKSGDFHGHVRTIALKHSLWQMDHIKPVVEGGGSCVTLDNLQSLCLRCHKQVTAELATRRARAKRPQQNLFGAKP